METPESLSFNLHPCRALAPQDSATAAPDKTTLYTQWNQWAENASPGERREIAVYRLKDCYERGANTLDLSFLGLRQLPDKLPAGVESLDIHENRLSQLPDALPAALKILNVNKNQLRQLPATLPASLESLESTHNHLTQLPQTLPVSLKVLAVNDNRLSQLPETLPAALQRLEANGNQLKQLPQTLPDALKMLTVNDNRLKLLPQTLPAFLHRLEADNNQLQQLPDTLPTSLRRLEAKSNQLTQLPDNLPISLKVLAVSENQLTQLPDTLPAALEVFEISGNQLMQLPPILPASLKALTLNGNQLTQLPEILPASLYRLEISNNQLTQLPDTLPATLHRLEVNSNQLTQLPEHLPTSLQVLTVSRNRLTQLPCMLPTALHRLEANTNQLRQLPPILPVALKVLMVSRNRLTQLPERLPISLEVIEITRNQLTRLPETITTLPRSCGVFLENNPLSTRTRQQLQILADDNHYQGPQIMFSLSAGDTFTPLHTMEEIATHWYPPEHRAAIAKTWQAMTTEEGAQPFLCFLSRLADTVNAQDSGFKQAVSAWLGQLSTTPSLRSQTFILAQDATESCEDRVSLTFNEMQKARVVHQVETGHYDTQLPTLVSVAREMFRQECLEMIAREKVKTLRFVDEIEVYLAYQVKLREPLQLSSAVQKMRFFGVAHVTQDDLDVATLTVKSKENSQFPAWLSRWDPWEHVLQRLYKTPYQSAINRLHNALGKPFNTRVRAALQALKMTGDEEATREIGVKITEEITDDIKRPLTQQFLEDHQLLDLLDPVWEV